MKLGEFFIQLGVKGDTKKLKETLDDLKEAEEKTARKIKLEEKLAKAETDEQKALIKKNHEQKEEIVTQEKSLKGLQKKEVAMQAQIATFFKMIAILTTVAVAYDRLATSIAKAGQQAITFSRTSGMGLDTLNKYASQSAMVNMNASPDKMAGSLSNVQSNLWDIQMGRGDVSPYQELAFVGGTPINPIGKNAEQILEELRGALKGVDDVVATNIITRMGFNPEDLMMIRMTNQELAQTKNLFMSPEDQEEMNRLGIQLNLIHLGIKKAFGETVLAILPIWNKLMKVIGHFALHIGNIIQMVAKLTNGLLTFIGTLLKIPHVVQGIVVALGIIFAMLTRTNPALAAIIGTITALYLILDDLAVYFAGGDSLFGIAVEAIKKWGAAMKDSFEELKKHMPDFNDLLTKISEIYNKIGGALSHPIIFAKNVYQNMTGKQEIDTEKTSSDDNSLANALINPNVTPISKTDNVVPITNATTQTAYINQDNNVTIHTTQPADKAVAQNINEQYAALITEQRIFA